jgi:hypothetical protein
VLPAPPPTPLSYHERYAKLFAAAPLTFDDQITYFARLSTDVDSVNSNEALELLTVLRNREDLTVKMGRRIDEFLAQRNAPPGAATEPEVATAPTPHVDEPEATEDVSSAAPSNRRRWILAGGIGAIVLIGTVLAIALWPKSKENAAPLVENTECAADNCSDPPIQFLDISGDPETIKVTITDPVGAVREADSPTPYGDGLEWHWSPGSADPIGDYTVHFEGATSAPADNTFTVNAVEGPFGAVQRAGQAIFQHHWDAAAAIDQRIKADLQDPDKGEDSLNSQYPIPGQMYWVPYDASGRTNDNGTTIVGAFVSYVDADDNTTATCQLWSVDTGNQTMRSDSLPRDEKPHTYSHSGEPIPSDITSFVENDCKNLVSTD